MGNQGTENRPETDGRYLRPAAAYELMKTAQGMRRTVYIYGASGSGKTSFIADFFSRRRYEYYPLAQTRIEDIKIPEQTAGNKENIVVIDDLYLVDSQESREAVYPLLEEMTARKDIWLILLSRCQMPKWLKPLYINKVFITIDEGNLSFSEEDELEYLAKWEIYPMQETAKYVRSLSCGQPLFLRIVAMQLKLAQRNETAGSDRQEREREAVEQARRDLWDYFEIHVFDQWKIELQEFLMDVAIVDAFDAQLAQQITKKPDVTQLIAQALETGNFLEEQVKNGVVWYVFRQAMRFSMRRRLHTKCSLQHINEIYRSAGNGYEMMGDVPNALQMYDKCRDEEGISRLLVENARKNAGAGYYYALRKYYFALPEEMIRENYELMTGMCLLNSLLMNIDESERWYQLLENYERRQQGSTKRAVQAKLWYLDICLPHRGTVSVPDLLKRAGGLLAEGKTALPEPSVTSNLPSLMNGGADFCEWSKKDRELARVFGKLIEMVLGKYGKGIVSLALAESFFEKGEDNYEVSALANKGRLQAECGGKKQMVFVGVGILSQLAMLNDHADDAFDMLTSFRRTIEEDTPQLIPSIETLRTRFLLYHGRSAAVADWMKTAPDEEQEFFIMERFRYLTKVRVYLAMGKKERAYNLIQRLLAYAEMMHRPYVHMECHVLLAITQYRMGSSEWKQTLQYAISKAEEYHFVRILSREGAALWELLKEEEFVWKDEKYKKQVLKECETLARRYPVYLSEKQEGNVFLSDKALAILRLQSEGYSIEEIAEQMNLSKAGVKYYNQDTYKKLGVRGKAAALTEARNRRLI